MTILCLIFLQKRLLTHNYLELERNNILPSFILPFTIVFDLPTYDDAVRMNTTITPVRKTTPPSRRHEPKSFMESTEFVELRGNKITINFVASEFVELRGNKIDGNFFNFIF